MRGGDVEVKKANLLLSGRLVIEDVSRWILIVHPPFLILIPQRAPFLPYSPSLPHLPPVPYSLPSTPIFLLLALSPLSYSPFAHPSLHSLLNSLPPFLALHPTFPAFPFLSSTPSLSSLLHPPSTPHSASPFSSLSLPFSSPSVPPLFPFFVPHFILILPPPTITCSRRYFPLRFPSIPSSLFVHTSLSPLAPYLTTSSSLHPSLLSPPHKLTSLSTHSLSHFPFLPLPCFQ